MFQIRKNAMVGILLSLLIILLAACGSDGENTGAQETEDSASGQTLRISLSINDQHPIYHSAVHFKELLEEKTDDFTVEVYHSSQIASDRESIELLQFGEVEIAIPSTPPVMNFVPEYGIFDLPYLMPSTEVADEVLDGPFGDKMLDLLEDQDLVGLAWWENGFRNLTNSTRPVETLEDVEGLKVRTQESEIEMDSWEALGASPTPMSFGELYTGLQQGTVDGQINSYSTTHLSKFQETQEYFSDTQSTYTPLVFLFSKPIWDTLTEEQQQLIEETALEARLYNRELSRELDQESFEALEESMTFTPISDEEREKFIEASQSVIEKHKGNIGEDLVDEYMNEIEKHSN
jgi:tripartite ATP-independent transporter DctP family solute receptor